MNIKDSVILITGASTRVGREIGLYLANLGANISFSYYLDTEPWRQTLADLEMIGVKSLATQTEIRDSTRVKHLIDETIK